MSRVDFDRLFDQADRFRDSAQVAEAVRAYQDIASLATEDHEADQKARALHLAGLSAAQAVAGQPNSYFRDAFSFYHQAEAILTALNSQRRLGALYRDMAKTADSAGQSAEAMTYFSRATEKLTAAEAVGELAITYDKIGLHYYRLKQFDEAKKFTDRALALYKDEPTAGFFRATTLYDAARIELKRGELDQALDLATEALSWFDADHPGKSYHQRQAEISALLGVIYAELSQTKQSEKFFDRYQKLLKTFDPLAIKTIEATVRSLLA